MKLKGMGAKRTRKEVFSGPESKYGQNSGGGREGQGSIAPGRRRMGASCQERDYNSGPTLKYSFRRHFAKYN